MDIETVSAIVLVGLLVVVSLDFDKYYAPGFHTAARHPFARFLAGLAIVVLAATNTVLASIALVIVFFWIANVDLLSTIQLN